ncbi:MAG: hypothetical protein IT373_38320, partial [Polyangiaceae bacterium]|nr:hypothetical protein [Polyangiaceae bacterium]
MKQHKRLGSWLGIALGVAAFGAAFDAGAAKPTKDKVSAEAPTLPTAIALTPAKLAFGQKPLEVGAVYDPVIDADHLKELQDAQPGVQMDSLLAEIAEKKRLFRRTLLEFSKINTKWDSTPLATEYTYDNQEALMVYSRKGKTRYFFFIQNKLFKVIDELKLGEKSKYGPDFKSAVEVLNKVMGIEGRLRAPDAAAGRPFEEVDWRDSQTHVRAINWGDGKVGFAYEDN